MIPLRCIIVQGICELKQRKEGENRHTPVLFDGTHFFPFGDASHAAGNVQKILFRQPKFKTERM
ncbi:hypothetical protein BSK63_16950 [Paenibacillus odorifer]|uniref:hypothetical protein n=1 Tax=Paenibacillus odorifer TaxID=189426 RepID=UPI00096C7148|nr:hypothetical protein [Paenibacillus odorifer]OME30583.1 hypothetical protein BSK63_16950 [Paenibacillus odorifer]